MSSFKKNVTFAPSTIFIEPSRNSVVPRLDPPLPAEFKSALWYSQRELAYMQYEEYRQKHPPNRGIFAACGRYTLMFK